MNAAFFYHDLASARQGAVSGLRELQQSACQGNDALLVHVNSFQVQFFDANHYASEGVGGVQNQFGEDQNVFAG